MGAGCPPGHGAQSLRPIWWRWWRRAGACVAIRPAPGLMLRSRPCLTRAERTKRSGPVCARGSSRGRSGGPGAWRRSSAMSRWSSSSSERSATQRSASRRSHLRTAAADTSAAAADATGAHLARPSLPPGPPSSFSAPPSKPARLGFVPSPRPELMP